MSTIIKRQPDLQEAFGAFLTFSPTPRQLEQFEHDVARMHPAILRDALRELAAKPSHGILPEQQRFEIHRIYTRKVKEISALWPFIFAVENSLRALLTELFDQRFGRRDWWKIFEIWIKSNQADQPTHINGRPINKKLSKTILRAVDAVMNKPREYSDLSLPANANRFLYYTTFSEIISLIDSSWPAIKAHFNSVPYDNNITKEVVLSDLRRVRDGRNEVSHCNPIKKRSEFLGSCDRVAASVGYDLERFDRGLGVSQYVRGTLNAKRECETPIFP